MAPRIDIDNINGFDIINVIVSGKARIGIDHARIKTNAQNGGDALFLAFLQMLPFVIAIPWRRFANLRRIFMNGRIHIGNACIDTCAQDRHIEEGRADIDDDLNARFLDQRLGRLYIHRVQCVRFQLHLGLEALLFMHAFDNPAAFLNRAGRNVDIPQYIRVLRTFMRYNLCHASGADNENVLLHFLSMLPLPAVSRHLLVDFRVIQSPLMKASLQSPHSQIRGPH